MIHFRSFSLALLVALPALLSAQDDDAGLRIGLTFSPKTAWLRSDSKGLESDGNKLGYRFGLITEFPLSSRGTYYFSTGLLLDRIGGDVKAAYTVEGTSTNVVSRQTIGLSYLELPVTLKLRAGTAENLRFYAQLGFNPSINIRARSDFSTTSTTGNDVVTDTSDNEDVMESISLFRMGLLVGGGVELKLSSVTLFGGLTFNNSFTNVLDKDAKRIINPEKKSKLHADYLELTFGAFF
jgi:hypothetical protein